MTAAGAHVRKGRDWSTGHALGGSLYSRIRSSKILMVGARGIGCELLKNLVLAGFNNVEIVDLDTIDLSNLNRQFLFRHEHIKKSKALVSEQRVLLLLQSDNPRHHRSQLNECILTQLADCERDCHPFQPSREHHRAPCEYQG